MCVCACVYIYIYKVENRGLRGTFFCLLVKGTSEICNFYLNLLGKYRFINLCFFNKFPVTTLSWFEKARVQIIIPEDSL